MRQRKSIYHMVSVNKNIPINTHIECYKNRKIEKKDRMTHRGINTKYKGQNTKMAGILKKVF